MTDMTKTAQFFAVPGLEYFSAESKTRETASPAPAQPAAKPQSVAEVLGQMFGYAAMSGRAI